MTHELNSNTCSLNDDNCREIMQSITQDLFPKLNNLAKNDENIVLSFASDRTIARELQHLIELEKQCCACLQFNVQQTGEETNVQVTHVAGSESLHTALQTLLSDCCGSMPFARQVEHEN